MEVVEHVADVALFVRRCADMVKPGGLMVAATLNRTLKSFALAIVGAEYVLRWLPRGTHQWDKFVTPNELEIAMARAGLRVSGETGVIYNPLADHWRLSSDMDVNYMLTAAKGAPAPTRISIPWRDVDSSWLWAVFTLIAAAAQTVRNAAQRELTGKLGTVGATHVRFLFGCPFALVFLLGDARDRRGAAAADAELLAVASRRRADAQIAATALMLAAMAERSFVVTIAYIKTEPVQVALFGLVFLGDAVTPMMAAAIVIATAGVIVMSLKGAATSGGASGGGWRPTAARAIGRRVLRAVGHRLSRRDPEPRTIRATPWRRPSRWRSGSSSSRCC